MKKSIKEKKPSQELIKKRLDRLSYSNSDLKGLKKIKKKVL